MSTVERTGEILSYLGHPPYYHRLSDISEGIGYSKSAAYKLLQSLTESGFVLKNSDKKYSIGPQVYLLGKIFEREVGIESIIKPFLLEIRNLTEENVSFCMPVNGRPVLISRVSSLHRVQVVGEEGQERYFYAGAAGKLLGAYSDFDFVKKVIDSEGMHQLASKTITSISDLQKEYCLIREKGYAISYMEVTDETMGISAPVYGIENSVWGTISIACPIQRMTEEKLAKYIEILKKKANEVSKNLKDGFLKK